MSSPVRFGMSPVRQSSAATVGSGLLARWRHLTQTALFWAQIAPSVASMLLAENPLLVNDWVGMLRPVRQSLLRPLADLSPGLSDQSARRLAASILADYASEDPMHSST